MAPVGERLAAAVARAVEGHDCTAELMSIWSGFTLLEEGKRRPNQELQAVLEEELTFVRVQELAAPGRLTASRCMVLELGATFVELVAVTLISDMRSSRAITSLSEEVVAETDHSSRCSALSAALRSLGREGRPRRGLATFVDAILKMLAGRSLIPAGLAALSNVCGLKLAAAEAEPLRGSAAELAAAFIGALATEPKLALKGFALMLKAGPAVTLREAALLHEAPLLAALPALPEARRTEGLAVLAILADPRANSPLPSETRLLRLQNLLRSWSLGTPTPTLAAGFLLVLSNEISAGRDFAGATVSALLHELGELRDVWPPAVAGAGELLLSTALQCSPGDRDSYLTTCVLTIGFDFVVAEEVREGLASWLSGMASLPACAPSLSRASQLVLYRTLCHYREPSSPGLLARFHLLPMILVESLLNERSRDATVTSIGAAVDRRVAKDSGLNPTLSVVRAVVPSLQLTGSADGVAPSPPPSGLFADPGGFTFGAITLECSDGTLLAFAQPLAVAQEALSRTLFFKDAIATFVSSNPFGTTPRIGFALPLAVVKCGVEFVASGRLSVLKCGHKSSSVLPPQSIPSPALRPTIVAADAENYLCLAQQWQLDEVASMARVAILRDSITSGNSSVQGGAYLYQKLGLAVLPAAEDLLLAVAAVVLARMSSDGFSVDEAAASALKQPLMRACGLYLCERAAFV